MLLQWLNYVYLSASTCGFYTIFEQMYDVGDVTDDEEFPADSCEFEGENDTVVSCTVYILVTKLVKPK